jgi:hypothetical protein
VRVESEGAHPLPLDPTQAAQQMKRVGAIVHNQMRFWNEFYAVILEVYGDMNGDGKRQADTDALGNYIAAGTEPIVLGGAVSLSGLGNPYSQTLDTVAGLDPVCFTDVPGGKYTVSAAVPDGFNSTTVLTYELLVTPGDSVYVNFGAQVKVETTPVLQKKTSPLLGVFGAIILLAGIGLGFYAWRMRKA